MNCICGHREQAHMAGGRCRVPDCPCERFQPGDTVPEPASAARLRIGESMMFRGERIRCLKSIGHVAHGECLSGHRRCVQGMQER
jgi:hypothetical protein